MLDKQDIESIGNIIDAKLDAKFNEKFSALRGDIHTGFEALDTKITKTEKKIILAIGEMLEDNVFPQFEEVHRELRRMNTVIGWQQ